MPSANEAVAKIADTLILIDQTIRRLSQIVQRLSDDSSHRDARREREHDIIRRDVVELRMSQERLLERIGEARRDIKDVRDNTPPMGVRLHTEEEKQEGIFLSARVDWKRIAKWAIAAIGFFSVGGGAVLIHKLISVLRDG